MILSGCDEIKIFKYADTGFHCLQKVSLKSSPAINVLLIYRYMTAYFIFTNFLLVQFSFMQLSLFQFHIAFRSFRSHIYRPTPFPLSLRLLVHFRPLSAFRFRLFFYFVLSSAFQIIGPPRPLLSVVSFSHSSFHPYLLLFPC